MSAWTAFREGIRRVNSAPVLLCALVFVTPLVVFSASAVAGVQPDAHQGFEAPDHRQATAPTRPWWLAAQATSLEAMATPSTIWLVDVVRRVRPSTDHPPSPGPPATMTIGWLIAWALLGGGILDRYARPRPGGARGVLAACAAYFWRFLRLAVPAAALWLLFRPAWWPGLATTQAGDGALPLAAFALLAVLAAPAAVVFDYARVRLVAEDRRSVIGALAAAVRFVGRRARPVCGLFVLHALALTLTMAVYHGLSERAERADMHGWLVHILGQAYIVARHYVALLVYASATALVQGTPAPGDPMAADALEWPESPSAEPLTGTEAASAS